MINKIKNNKFINIIIKIIKAIVTLFIIFVVSIIFIQRVSDNKISLGGISIYTIITPSMVPKYNIGDMVIAKKVDVNNLRKGDDVVYLGNKDDFDGKIITHEIMNIENENGKILFHTKGIANDIEDPIVSEEQIMGKVIFKSKLLSLISKVVNNSYGFYFVIFIPFTILVTMEIIDIIDEKKRKE
ncbi:MAG: signal peptidase I [Bacilli bacterium]